MSKPNPKAESTDTPAWHFSLRSKLTLWVVSVVMIIQGTLVVVLLLFHRSGALEAFDLEMDVRSKEMVRHLSNTGPPWTDAYVGSLARENTGHIFFERFMLAVCDAEDDIVATSAPNLQPLVDATWQIAAVNGDAVTIESADGKPELRAHLRSFTGIDGQQYHLWTANSLTYVNRSVRTVRNVLLWTLPITFFAASVAGWFLAGVGVQPIQKVIHAAEELSPESIDQKIDLQSTDSEMVKLQQHLNEARQRINEGYSAQERFILNVSHELKTPIAVLLTEAQVLQQQKALEPEAEQFVKSVEEEMQRLGSLAESFLLVAQIHSGKREIREELTPLNDIVLDSIQHCSGFAEQEGIPLHLTLFEGDPAEELLIKGDVALLRTMIDNLIRNAIRFSPQGQSVAVNIVADLTARNAKVTVQDQGPGVPAELIDHLFERFAQAEDERKRNRGTGLGLEIAQGIANLHGGRITAQNGEQRGCEFAAELPIYTEDVPDSGNPNTE